MSIIDQLIQKSVSYLFSQFWDTPVSRYYSSSYDNHACNSCVDQNKKRGEEEMSQSSLIITIRSDGGS